MVASWKQRLGLRVQPVQSASGKMINSFQDLACEHADGSCTMPQGDVCAWPRERNVPGEGMHAAWASNRKPVQKSENMQMMPIHEPMSEPDNRSITANAGPGIKAGAIDMAKGLVRSAATLVTQGRASQAERDSRLEVCNGCSSYIANQKRCSECGCFMEAKTWIKGATCPLGYW